ncbi:MAG: flavodoxin domain-containing protein [Candidatus Bathyarchaeia archaeon]
MVKVELVNNVFWVGAIDWNIKDFHGYTTKRGTTYNAYLIKDEQNVLVDTVKYTFANELNKNVSEIVNLESLDYIVINHVEMDHSSALPHIIKHAKNAEILSSQKGKESLTKYYGENLPVETVKTGDKLRIGKRNLMFIEAPMLHWPDSMFTYVMEDGILMPNDAFGQHLATSQRFDDQIEESVLMEEASKYYANILMPFAPLITRKIQEITQMGIPLRIIAPSHGVIWRSNPAKIVDAYIKWSGGATKNKVVIVYDTIWNSTTAMAFAISDGIASQGVEVKFFKLRDSDITEVVNEILEAKAVIVGSSTLNNSMFPSVSAFLTYITGLKPKGKLWAFFGSYGWGGGAVKQMVETAKKANFEVYEQTLEVQYAPTKSELEKCFNFGKQIAEKIRQNT